MVKTPVWIGKDKIAFPYRIVGYFGAMYGLIFFLELEVDYLFTGQIVFSQITIFDKILISLSLFDIGSFFFKIFFNPCIAIHVIILSC
ncbi:MAG: hypothetical protein HON76_18180 [Candidatus Scalindua sp.]|nr:hypothetical protein [Candidatus Scalindua sp.]MBT6564450.1 hypothetical protein [Candidatus Scalindua sp.]